MNTHKPQVCYKHVFNKFLLNSIRNKEQTKIKKTVSADYGYSNLFIENKNKATTIVQLNKKTKELEKYSELLETGTATEYMDIKESDGLISMAYLYQDKELIERHGIGVIIGKQYYRIGIAPEIGTTLNKNSKIIKITDNEIEFTFNLNNDTEKSV